MIYFFYIFPFVYFYATRLQKKILPHVVFEWFAAAFLVLFFRKFDIIESLFLMLFSYLAFISLYEIGYIANDLFSSHKEQDGRKRGPQGVNVKWIFIWCFSRILFFIFISIYIDKINSLEWWSFFFL